MRIIAFTIFVWGLVYTLNAQTVIYVPSDYPTIQQGLDAANEGDTVQVAQGTYYENIIWPNTNGIKLIGADSSNTIIDGNTLSGVISISPTSVILDSSTIIQGFKITNGGNTARGGGITINGFAYPKLVSLLITQNFADNGGGIYANIDTGGKLILENMIITENSAKQYGGGIDINGDVESRDVIISRNHVSVTGRGAGVYISSQLSTFINTIIDSNYFLDGFGSGVGGGMYMESGDISFKNIQLVNNFSSGGGGGLSIFNGNAFFLGGVIANNTAVGIAGGIRTGTDVYLSMKDTKIINNIVTTASSGVSNGGGFYFSGNKIQDLVNVAIVGNNAKLGGGIYGYNFNLTNSKIIRNNAREEGGGIYVSYKGVSVNKSTISNNFPSAIYVAGGVSSVSKSNIQSNNYGIFNYDNSNIFDADSVYWGSESGPYNPSQNLSGHGDSTNQFVNITPWLREPDTDAPPIPVQNLSVMSTTDTDIILEWNSSLISDIAGYKIYYDIESTDWEFRNLIDVGLDTNFTLTNLDIGKTYYLSVTCYDTEGNESWYSKTISAKTTPASIIELNYTQIDFGNSVINNEKDVELLISNTGTKVLTILSSVTSTSEFYTNQNIELNIDPSSSKILPIYFKPTNVGNYNDNLVLSSNAVNNPSISIPLLGEGIFSEAPVIISIDDVPDDQGGQVRIKFQASRYDGSHADSSIQTYSVWRQINDSNDWDAVGLFNAIQEPSYFYVAPTIGDSTIHELIWSKFKVSAHTSDPNFFYMSKPDSGYSIDNIAPEAPTGLSASSNNGIAVELSWKANLEKDFAYYSIYRGHDENFVADSTSLLTTTVDTTYTDSEILNGTYYYKVTAFDYSGNESEPSQLANVLVGIETPENTPEEYSLTQNFPNPFNPTSEIKYAIVKPSKVSLRIYDILGKEVLTLVHENQDAGNYIVTVDANKLTSGIYFYRLQAGDYVETKKMILLK